MRIGKATLNLFNLNYESITPVNNSNIAVRFSFATNAVSDDGFVTLTNSGGVTFNGNAVFNGSNYLSAGDNDIWQSDDYDWEIELEFNCADFQSTTTHLFVHYSTGAGVVLGIGASGNFELAIGTGVTFEQLITTMSVNINETHKLLIRNYSSPKKIDITLDDVTTETLNLSDSIHDPTGNMYLGWYDGHPYYFDGTINYIEFRDLRGVNAIVEVKNSFTEISNDLNIIGIDFLGNEDGTIIFLTGENSATIAVTSDFLLDDLGKTICFYVYDGVWYEVFRTPLDGGRGLQGISPIGAIGSQGATGDDGRVGAQGIQGVQGSMGVQGEPGDKGSTSAEQGDKGDPGDPGFPGDPGNP